MAASTLIGRSVELGLISEALDRASRGAGSAFVLSGEPGIGKSVLLAAASAQSAERDIAVISTSGVEIETGLPFGGLHRLIRPLLAQVDELDELHRGVLRAALGLGEEPPGELYVVALGVLELLVARASQTPLLVMVDDVQWLDGPSRAVLAFVGRRLSEESIVLLCAMRDGYDNAAAELGLELVLVSGLEATAAAKILDARDGNLATAVRNRLLAEAAGNPLALVELPTAATAHAADGEAVVLPISARLERAFAARAHEMPQVTQSLLLIAAADEASRVSEILSAGSRLSVGINELSADHLEPAVRAGLITLNGDAVHYRHPLVRSAIYQSAPLGEQLAAHAALAEALDGDDADRRTWHRAAAAVGRDDDVADEVDAMARRARARGAILDAATTLRRAAELTEDGSLRADRLLESAELAFEAGRPDLVQETVEAASQISLGVRDRARAELLSEAFYDGVAGDVARVYALVDDARQVDELGDVELALQLLQGAAVRCWWAALAPEVRSVVLETAESLSVSRLEPRLLAIIACVSPLERGSDVVERIPAALEAAGDDVLSMWFIAMAAHAVADHELSLSILNRLIPLLRQHGRFGLLTQVLSMAQWDAAMLGDWDAAEGMATEGDRLADETGQRVWGAGTTCGLSAVAAIRGNSARANQLAAAAEAVIVPHGLADMHAVLLVARGLAAVTDGRHDDAFAVLQRLFDHGDPAHHYREQFGGLGYFAEAAAGCGRVAEARLIVERLSTSVEPGGAPALRQSIAFAVTVLNA